MYRSLVPALVCVVALLVAGSPATVPGPKSSDAVIVSVDQCTCVVHGSAADEKKKERAKGGNKPDKPGKGGKGGGGKGGDKEPACAKTYAAWPNQVINVFIDGSGAPAGILESDFELYVMLALTEWSCHSGLGEGPTFDFVSEDADITIQWGDLGSTGVLGRAVTSFISGTILHSDITMNSNEAAFTWTLGPMPDVDADGCAIEDANGSVNQYDLLSVMTHEFGHSLGVSHPNNRCNVRDKCYAETMYSCTDAAEFMRRAINPGDRGAIEFLYGADS